MTVYVDNARIPFRRMLMSHLVADTLPELHAMADQLGIRRWFQDKASFPHYDVCTVTRQRAIKLGAVPLDRRKMVALIQKLRGGDR